MKNILIVIAFILGLGFFSTCRQDPATPPKPTPCDTVRCENGGTCNDGKCLCPEFYSGVHCGTYYTTLLAGNYTSDNFNCGLLPISGDSEVKVNPENKNQLLLPQGLVADMAGYNFTVQPKSQLGVTIWGEGYFVNDLMYLKINIGSPLTGVLATCEGDFNKVK